MNAKGILVNCIICACVIAASAHYVLKVERAAVEQINARQNAWEAEKEALLAAKSSSQPSSPDVQLSLDTDSTLLIHRLSNLNSDSKKKLREAFFCFQGLVEEGEKAIPAIRDYFTTGENVVLIENTGGFRGRGPGNRNGRGRNNNFNNNNTGTANTDLPSTTRIGLIDVLNDIGGKDAINLLGQILPTTLNAQELSYLSTILQSIDSNIFVNTTITTARNLLANTSITEGDKRQLRPVHQTEWKQLQDSERDGCQYPHGGSLQGNHRKREAYRKEVQKKIKIIQQNSHFAFNLEFL